MNYHIIFNNSYCLEFINDVLTLGEEKNNVFWFRGEDDGSLRLSDNVRFKFLGKGYGNLEKELLKIASSDNIIVHYFDLNTARFLKDLPNTIFAFMWGGDFFQDPYWYHVNWVFAPKTRRYVIKNEREKFILRKNISAMFRQFKKIFVEPKKLYKEKNEQMKFVDYILCNEHNKADVKKARELYPNLKAPHLGASYDLRFDKVLDILEKNFQSKKVQKGKVLKILLGNSATTANNHLDAFDFLESRKDIEIHCVLAYGDMDYAEHVIKKGKEIFGENFKPMTKMKSPEEYIQFLNEMDVVVMNHYRSQAWGNISQCLAMGLPVFMHGNNALKSYIDAIGLKIYDINDFHNVNLESIIEEEQSKIDDIRNILKEISSDKVRLNCLRNIFDNYMS